MISSAYAKLARMTSTVPSISSRLRGIVFDMDGTITHAGAIDFAKMRARCGVPDKMDIIAFCESQAEPKRTELLSILEEEEELGLSRMSLRSDARDLMQYLKDYGIHRALLTRNNDAAMQRTVALLDTPEVFSIMLSRSFTPVKPHPAAILHICEKWSCLPSQVIMCGDSLDDMACGRAAGAITVLIGENTCKHYKEAEPFADYCISSLSAMIDLLETLE